MLKSDAAAFLAGVKQVEGAAASAPTNLHVITGEVGTTSEDGKTTISLDGLVFSEEDSQEIEMDTLGGLEEGDVATVLLTGENGRGMTPLAIGAPGSIDRIKTIASNAAEIANAAQGVAEATNQHFFADTSGIHVTEATQEEWDASNTGANVLINSIGQLFRDGLNNLLTLTTRNGARALAIWDGLGNNAGNVLAQFSADGTRIGAESSAHSVWESGEFIFNDGTNDTMKLSAPESITETHVMPSDDISFYEYIELEYPPASLISVEVDNTDYTYTPTITPYGLRLWKDGGDGDAFDGETVTVTYKPSPAMYIYDGKGDDVSNIAARINANKVSLAKDVFSFSAQYDSHSGSLSGGGIRIGDSDESLSEMVLSFSSDRSYLLFQTSASNRTAGFILDSGSADEPERVLDLIYLDRINYVDPYGGGYRQLGKPQRLTAGGSYTAGTADTMGPAVTLTAGIWLIEGSWAFTNSSSNSKRLVVGLYRSSTGNAYTYRVHTTASSTSVHRIEVSDTIVVSAARETVTLYGASSPASTAAATQYITGIKLA